MSMILLQQLLTLIIILTVNLLLSLYPLILMITITMLCNFNDFHSHLVPGEWHCYGRECGYRHAFEAATGKPCVSAAQLKQERVPPS